MARQSTTPVSFNKSVRSEQGVLMSSGRAGIVIPVAYWPLLRGDSCSGRVSVDFSLAEMPRPLLNAVMLNVQAWFVQKNIHPQFNGTDEFLHSYTGEPIKALGAADRDPPQYFLATPPAAVQNSDFFKTLGIHVATDNVQTDLIDAFNVIYNFRLAAHSSKLPRRKYFSEDAAEALSFPRAFWPSGRFARIVPDYERALVVGALDLDVYAGRIPVTNLLRSTTNVADPPYYKTDERNSDGSSIAYTPVGVMKNLVVDLSGAAADAGPLVFSEMADQTVTTSLADIDKARTTQAFAKLRTAYAGNDPTGFGSDETILAHLMQGLQVPADMLKRPWLLDSARVPFGFNERFSTDAAELDTSVTTGATSVSLNINVPQTEYGGVVIITAEVLPERLDERQADEWLYTLTPDALPNALRDIQNPEPVDFVTNRRIDAKHTQPAGLYGYEPMNDKWNRSFTRLGGAFYQPTPGTPVTEQRSGIWQADVVDPTFTDDHWLAPAPFPHYVFADTQAPAFEFVCRHSCKIVGLTQIGDPLSENNDDWAAVQGEQAQGNGGAL